MLASHLNRPKIVKLLLDFKADVTAKDICGEQAIHHASKEGTVEVIQLLLSYSKILNEESGLGLNPIDCTIQKLIKPMAEKHRTNEETDTMIIEDNFLKSYQILISKLKVPTDRVIAKTDEVVHVAEQLTDLAARTVDKKSAKRLGKRARDRFNNEGSSSSSSEEAAASDTDEFTDRTSAFSQKTNLHPDLQLRFPKLGQIDVDMTDITPADQKMKDKDKKKDKKKSASSSESDKKKKSKKKRTSSSSEEKKKRKKKTGKQTKKRRSSSASS